MWPQQRKIRCEKEVEDELLLSKEKPPFSEREFELHFIFCVPDWWPMRWMMFCSAVWHCLIPGRHKEGEHLSSQTYVWSRGGRGCQNGEEGPGGRVRRGVGFPLIKRDGDELMTVEADGESHLPWRRSQRPPSWSQRGTDAEKQEDEGQKQREGEKKDKKPNMF